MWVLRRDSDGRFVAPAGSAHSYVWNLQDARTFPTLEAAEHDKCGNEYAVAVENIMQPCR